MKISRTYKPPIVWITGAGRGIGAEIAKQFSYIGCKVALSARTISELRKIQSDIIKDGGTAEIFKCDVRNEKQIISTHNKIEKRFGSIDVLVNNAGITSFNSFAKTSLLEFAKIIETNLNGSFYCTKQVLPNMMEKKDGWIFNIASVVVIKTFINSAAYSAAKAGIVAMSKVLREEVRDFNIKVINIYPGATVTEIWPKERLSKYHDKMLNPRNIAETILSIYRLNNESYVEELIIRPITGDLK